MVVTVLLWLLVMLVMLLRLPMVISAVVEVVGVFMFDTRMCADRAARLHHKAQQQREYGSACRTKVKAPERRV